MRFAWTDLRRMPGLLMAAGVVVLGLANFNCSTVSPKPNYVPRDHVWRHVQREASRNDLDPGFVYAIIAAESSFNSRAHNQQARGMMQLTPAAWDDVTDLSFRRAWDWRTNVSVGTDYLGLLKKQLEADRRFSYPLLAASYRYGYGHVRSVSYNLNRLPATRNRIYQELFRGSVESVRPPA